jgi:hypothetical protein
LTRPHRFAIASCEESWLLATKRRMETRLVHGELEERDGRIDASDRRDDDLVRRAEAAMDALRVACQADAGALRLFASARRAGDEVVENAHAIFTLGSMSVVTDAEHFAADADHLSELLHGVERIDYRGVPIVWRGGSAAVLLHEAAGHAAEKSARPLTWPRWLRVTDVPTTADDTGERPERADLLAGEPPRALRRESFIHAVSPRMTNLVVEHESAPFDLPPRRIEVQLLRGGHYEVLADTVTLFVAAATLVDRGNVSALAPFAISEPREDVVTSITGAHGPSGRYPGVICSSEGQDLVVGSSAPELLTVF